MLSRTFAVAVYLMFGLVTSALGDELRIALPPDDSYAVYRNSYALLIGVSKFDNFPALERIPKEIDKLSDALVRQHYLIEPVVLNKNGDGVRKAITDFLAKRSGPHNRLFIYYSGHGTTITDNVTDNRQGFLVSADSKKPAIDETQFRKTAVSLSWLKKAVTDAPNQHLLLVLDSCFSGEIFGTKGFTSPSLYDLLQHKGKHVVQVITATDEDHVAPPKSQLVPALIAGMSGGANTLKKGFVTGLSLGDYVQNVVAEDSNHTSLPLYNSIDGSGDMVVGSEMDQGATILKGEPDKAFTGVKVVYYPKHGDGNGVRVALHQSRIPLDEKPSILKEDKSVLRTNLVACHPSVPVEAVKKVAIALLKAGYPISSVSWPAKRVDQVKNTIQVLHSNTRKGRVLTVAEVSSLTECPKNFEKL